MNLRHRSSPAALLLVLSCGLAGACARDNNTPPRSPQDTGLIQARALRTSGDRDLSLKALRRLEAAATRPDDLQQIALQYDDWKEYPDAVRVLRTLTEKRPGNAAYWIDLSESLLRGGSPGQARVALEKAESLPTTPADKHCLATTWRDLGELQRAAALISIAGRLAPDAEVWIDQADIELRLKRPQAAREALGRAERSLPSADGWHRIAGHYRNAGSWPQAEAAMKQAGRPVTEEFEFAIGLSNDARSAGDRAAALQVLRSIDKAKLGREQVRTLAAAEQALQ